MTVDSKGRELFIVDNSVSGWTGLRYPPVMTSDAAGYPGPVRQATTKQHLREAGGPNWLQPAQARGHVTGQAPNACVRSDPFAVESRCRRLGWALTG